MQCQLSLELCGSELSFSLLLVPLSSVIFLALWLIHLLLSCLQLSLNMVISRQTFRRKKNLSAVIMSLFWQKPSRDVWWMNNNAKFKYNATTHETAVITANIHHAVDVQCNVYHAYRCTAQPYYLYFNWFCWKLKQQKIIKQYTVFINLIRVHLMQKATCMYTCIQTHASTAE